jgi:hypothetical protein
VDNVEDNVSLGIDFNYINVRLLYRVRNWPKFIVNVFEVLAPSGCIEIKEFEFLLQFYDLEMVRDSILII